ncbi:protein mono-ADP-ribosyltransferase PARP9-like isoform X1 [Phyllobates terribilis]|uniref:protein mono-ADP-ribosyltransferase PARP9-like isoform X1 n=1 Tax=Phyllobates terribilis TaxID=111132 RepID=UPI003CCB4634
MDSVQKVSVPADVFRALLRCESSVNDVFIQRFRCTAEVTGPRPAASPASLKVYEKRPLHGPLISVWRDDLTRQDCDVVVNAANGHLDHMAGLAYALVKAGGRQIVQESEAHIAREGPVKTGEIAVTSAGSLPSKTIVHAVGPIWSSWTVEQCKMDLHHVILNVLRYVSSRPDLHSVAIPAVSSGIFGFPLDLCADIIVKTVQTFCSRENKNRLSEVRLVNNDDKTVQAMRAACERILGSSDRLTAAASSSRSAASSSRSPHTAHWQQETSITINGLSLHLKMGMIEDQKTTVIVNSVSSDLNLSYGAVSAAIYQKAGSKLQNEIKENHKRNSKGKVILTHGGNLPCRYVYHVILQYGKREAERSLREVTRECLQIAHSNAALSISFPALGSGHIGLEKDRVADIMTQTVLDFARATESRMDVNFIIHPSDWNMLQAFQDKLRKSGNINDKNVEFTQRPRGPESSVDEMCVRLAGGCAEDVGAAAAWLGGLLSANPLLIHNNHLLLCGNEELDVFSSCPQSVDIEEEVKDGEATLRIHGPCPDRVMAAIQAERLLLDVQDKMAESLEDELLAAAVIWFYNDRPYSAKANREVEEAVMSGRNVTLSAPPGHVIDGKSRTARGRDKTFTLRRLSLLQTPRTPARRPAQVTEVDPQSSEFRKRSKEFEKASLVLVKMEKVQNELLSGVFQSKKEAMKTQKPPSAEQMYQLLPGQSWRTVCDVGCHKLYGTSKDVKFRAGVYFKKTLPNILQRFVAPEKDGLLYILQAEVLIGATTKYDKNQPALPCAGSDALQLYDGLTDGGLPPDHFVIFDRFQANPQIVFTCKCKK